MIGMPELLIVIGVCALVGIHLLVVSRWLRGHESLRLVPAPITVHLMPRLARA